MGATFPLTLDATFSQANWGIDGATFPQVTSEVATPQTLTLSWRVTTPVLTSALRQLKPNQEQVDVLQTDDGGFVAVDRANGGNTWTLSPPGKRRPLRQAGTYHVQRYEEDLVSQDVGEWDVEVEFVPAANRTDSPTIDEPVSGATFPWTFDQAFERRSDNAWGFTTPLGEFWTDRVDAEFLGQGDDGVRRFELEARLRFDEAHSFEAAYARLGGARVRTIPDESNLAVDDTNGDATVTINSPDKAVVPDGDYVIPEPWESERLTEAYQNVRFTVAQT